MLLKIKLTIYVEVIERNRMRCELRTKNLLLEGNEITERKCKHIRILSSRIEKPSLLEYSGICYRDCKVNSDIQKTDQRIERENLCTQDLQLQKGLYSEDPCLIFSFFSLAL